MRKYKNKILTVSFIGILICGFGFYHSAEAAIPAVYVSPAALSKNVGETFALSIEINTAGNKVCLVEGKLNLDKLSCQSVKVEDGIMAQGSPSCSNLYFLLGIPGCTTDKKALFSVTAKAGNVGVATANFSGVDIIGEGVSISSTSSGGSYAITSPCNCGFWNAWQDGDCGGGGCSSAQRLQTRTRLCTPSGCEVKNEYLCKDDSGCIPRLPAMEAEEENVEEEIEEEKVEEEVIEQPIQEEVEEPQKEETSIPEEVTFPEEKILQKGLLASLAMTWKGVAESTLLIIVTILFLIGFIVIGVKEWRSFQKRKEE